MLWSEHSNGRRAAANKCFVVIAVVFLHQVLVAMHL